MMTKNAVKELPFVISGEVAWEPAGEGIERKVMVYDDQIMMVCARFAKGAIGSLHRHMHRQVSYVESGVFEITIAGNKKTLHRGDSFFAAPNFEHGAVALEEGTLIDVFTPLREDYL